MPQAVKTTSTPMSMANRDFANAHADTVLGVLGTINEAAGWARDNPEALAQVLASVTGVPIVPQRISAARGIYAVQPMDDHIIAQQQEIADTFARLRILPSRINVRAAVWQHAWQAADAR